MQNTTPQIEKYLEEVVRRNASDLHFQSGSPAILRIDGRLIKSEDTTILSDKQVQELILPVLDAKQKELLITKRELDFSFAFGDLARFRVNAFHEKGSLAAALRLIPTKIRTLEELGMPKIVSDLTKLPRGIVLITGPTGAGKTTTQAAMVDSINTNSTQHIITIEDPIEYQHHNKSSMVVQREVHFDTLSFAAALRSALREDPDVVLIGEMRDLETIATALTVAETGHLVLATLHTNGAAQSIDRIIDVFPSHQQQQIRVQLAGVLQGIISQRLIPMVGGGRVAATEIMVANAAVRNLIRENKSNQIEAVIQTGSSLGMQSMDKVLVSLVNQGKISYEDGKGYAIDVEQFNRLMGKS